MTILCFNNFNMQCSSSHQKVFCQSAIKGTCVCTHTDANKTCVIFVTLTVLFCRLGIPE